MHATESVYEQTATLCESVQGECQRCSKLERDLDVEKKERRELAVDNRRLYREKEELLRENSALREQLARLEAASTKNPLNDARKWMGMGFMTYDPQLKLFLIVLRSVP